MKKYLLMLSLLTAGFAAMGQSFLITGKVLKPDNTPQQGAKIVLEKDGTGVRGAFSDAEGKFELKAVRPGDYVMKVSMQGLADYSADIALSDKDIELEPVQMTERTYELNEVTIEGEVAQAEQKGDTTQYNAGAFKTNPDASAEDLVEKMPGVTVTNGQVQVGGENVQQVLVDGRRFFGDDPSAALKNLPAEVIDKIQVFDQQSEQAQATGFDDGETTKTINIVTKVNMRNGTFGRVYAGYGYDGELVEDGSRYKAGGNINYFNGARRITILAQSNNINQQNFASEDLLGVASGSGRRGGFSGRGGGGFGGGGGGFGGRGGGSTGDFLVNQQGGIANTHAFGLNYSDEWGKKVEVSGSYFFNLSNTDALTNMNRLYVTSRDSGQVYEEYSESFTRNLNHRFNMRLNYDITEKTSLLIRPRLTIQQNLGEDSTFASNSVANELLNNSNTLFNSDLLGIDFSNMLMLRHRFEKRGRSISLMTRTGYNENSGENYLNSDLNYFTNPQSFDSLNQNSSLNNNGWNVYTNLTYTEPISKIGMLQLNYSYSPQWNDSEKETMDYEEATGEYTNLNLPLSNTFNNTYAAHQVGGGMMIRAKKAFIMTRLYAQWANLSGEQILPVSQDINRDFFNILPMVMFRYRGENQNQIFSIYRARTNPPSVTQLQEVIDNTNPLQLQTGNKDLEQDYQHFLMMRYNKTNTAKSTVFYFMLSGNYTQNYIGNSTLIARRDTVLSEGIVLQQGGQLSRPVNLDGNWNLRAFLTYGFPLKPIKSNLNFNLSGDYRVTPGMINGLVNETSTATGGLGVVLSSNISEKVDFTLSSRSNFSNAANSLQTQLNNQYWNQTSSLKLNLIVGPGIVFRSTVTNQLYRGLSEDFNTDFWLWNMGLAKKVFKNQRGEIQLSVFDLMKQNNSITRTVSDIYIEDLQNVVLQRYVMLTFTYNIREFVQPQEDEDRDRRGGFDGPWRRD